jgi:alkanesulfonate monooxygenase SsuD/methylene tetrahydromethanopterin reductase-like flavin-dependent oxidoreductase (luciferase family)
LGRRSPGEKVDGLEESVRIIRGLWSQRRFTFRGRMYETDGAELEPKPEGHIPIWLGTYGPRALAVTGRLADGWIPTLELAPPDRIAAMRDRVRASARRAGRDPEEITCVYNLDIRVDERAGPSPTSVTGSPDAVVEQLRGLADLGFTAIHFLPVGPGEDEQIERLGREVLTAMQ